MEFDQKTNSLDICPIWLVFHTILERFHDPKTQTSSIQGQVGFYQLHHDTYIYLHPGKLR